MGKMTLRVAQIVNTELQLQYAEFNTTSKTRCNRYLICVTLTPHNDTPQTTSYVLLCIPLSS